MEEVPHFQERDGVSFVFVQFFPSFLFFPKEKTKQTKTKNIYTNMTIIFKSHCLLKNKIFIIGYLNVIC